MSFFAEIPLVVSYYTKNTPYEKEAENLRNSCKKFGIDHQIEGIPDQGDWVKNCAFKPQFLKQKMQEFQRPLLWVDADAVFLQPLCFEEFMFFPAAITWYEGVEDPAFAVHAGTLYINSSKEGLATLDLWCQCCESIVKNTKTTPPFLDQIGLFLLLKKSPSSISPIPERYCKVFDRHTDGLHPDDVVIEQRQASRRLNKGKKIRVSIVSRSQSAVD